MNQRGTIYLSPYFSFHNQEIITIGTKGIIVRTIKFEGDRMENQNYQAGDIVYVFYRNPHTQDVANIQSAAVVNNPQKEDELALFLYETYYPLSSEMAVYSTEEEANEAYNYYYGDESEGIIQ